jgi:short-subunit dehydrogenase
MLLTTSQSIMLYELLFQKLVEDVLVNNAGYGLVGTFEDLSIDDIKNQYETNVFGLMRVTQAVLPIMRRQKSGIIVNVSSGHSYLVILEVQPMLVSNLLLKV